MSDSSAQNREHPGGGGGGGGRPHQRPRVELHGSCGYGVRVGGQVLPALAA